jgi:hypothetical protein
LSTLPDKQAKFAAMVNAPRASPSFSSRFSSFLSFLSFLPIPSSPNAMSLGPVSETAMHDYTAGFENEETVILSSSDGELFKLPQMHLKVHSSVFLGMFNGSHDDGGPIGLSESSAVLSVIFDAMLHRTVEVTANLVQKNLALVLRACTKYEMATLALGILDCVVCVSRRQMHVDGANDVYCRASWRGSATALLLSIKDLEDAFSTLHRLLLWQIESGAPPGAPHNTSRVSGAFMSALSLNAEKIRLRLSYISAGIEK